MSSALATRPHFPRIPLALAFGMIAAALIVVAAARIAGVSPEQSLGPSQALETRLIRFETQGNGTIAVVDAVTGAIITNAGKEGFIPGVLRGLDRLRRTDQASLAGAYRVERLSNGQLLLIDTTSGLTLDLNAYGHGNAAVFAAFLPTTGDKS